MHITFQSEKLKGRKDLGNVGVDGIIILTLIIKEHGLRMWTGFTWFNGGVL
jgi:hypothetical protein